MVKRDILNWQVDFICKHVLIIWQMRLIKPSLLLDFGLDCSGHIRLLDWVTNS